MESIKKLAKSKQTLILGAVIIALGYIGISKEDVKNFTAGNDINNTETTDIKIDSKVNVGDEVNNNAENEASNENTINIK